MIKHFIITIKHLLSPCSICSGDISDVKTMSRFKNFLMTLDFEGHLIVFNVLMCICGGTDISECCICGGTEIYLNAVYAHMDNYLWLWIALAAHSNKVGKSSRSIAVDGPAWMNLLPERSRLSRRSCVKLAGNVCNLLPTAEKKRSLVNLLIPWGKHFSSFKSNFNVTRASRRQNSDLSIFSLLPVKSSRLKVRLSGPEHKLTVTSSRWLLASRSSERLCRLRKSSGRVFKWFPLKSSDLRLYRRSILESMRFSVQSETRREVSELGNPVVIG